MNLNTSNKSQLRLVSQRAWWCLTASAVLLISSMIGCGNSGEYHDHTSTAPASGAADESFSDDSVVVEYEGFRSEAPTTEAAAAASPHDRGAAERVAIDISEATDSVKTEEAFAPNNGRQSGVLTAGSFDDVANFDDYQSFLNRFQQQAKQCQLPLNTQTRQTVIRVIDDQGRPLGNTRCIVRQPGSNTVLLDRRTGTDGRVMLLTDCRLSHPQQTASLLLEIYAEDEQEATISQVRAIDREWVVKADNCETDLPDKLDIALVIDTTGSMGDELEYLKTEIDSIVSTVNRMFPNVSQRYSLVTYRDNGDQYVCRNFDFTESLSDFRRHLDAQSANGGGDFPEAMDVALNAATDLSWRNGDTARVLFLVGDAPPHRENLGKAIHAVEQLADLGVRVFPVGASGVEATAQVVMRTASLLTMGQYLFLTDHSGVGLPHATPDVPEFAVERLDRLMIRMIASELAGKRLVPDEVIAIERGERYSYLPTPRCVQPPTLVCVEPPQPAFQCGFVEEPATASLGMVMQWVASHVLVTVVALVAGIYVFDHLTRSCPFE